MNVEAMKETIQSFIIREQWCGVDFLRLTSHAILLVLVRSAERNRHFKQFWMADHTNHVAYIFRAHIHLP